MTMTRVYESIQLVSCSRNMLRLSLSRHRVRWGENEEWGKDGNTQHRAEVKVEAKVLVPLRS
jgi:hypothetical protein